jgi:phage shock protein B
MQDALLALIVAPTLLLGLPWLIFHYITRWKTAALTGEDEDLLSALHDIARRLDDRMGNVERIVAAEAPGRGGVGLEDRTYSESIRRIA